MVVKIAMIDEAAALGRIGRMELGRSCNQRDTLIQPHVPGN
jgi:hypothetical protein